MTVKFIAFTRPGYEKLLLGELKHLNVASKAHQGWAEIEAKDQAAASELGDMPVTDLIFARQLFKVVQGPLEYSSPGQLGDAMLAIMRGMPHSPSQIMVETPDVDALKGSAPQSALDAASEIAQAKSQKPPPRSKKESWRLHVFFADKSTCWLGVSKLNSSSQWPGGIPRLKLPHDIPSRSARKLEEALYTFVTPHEAQKALRAGMKAADLGAAPGGWSYVLASKGIFVAAIDNGDIEREVLETGLVTHFRADGFTWRPAKPLDWMVCDMITGGQRTAKLVGRWLNDRLATYFIFNLKLGQNPSLGEIESVKRILAGEAQKAGARIALKIKHLYHDRDEVTAFLEVLGHSRPQKKAPAPRQKARPEEKPPSRGRSGARRS